MRATCLLLLAVLAVPSPAAAETERRMAPSDPAAERLAKRVLRALGGREAWNETRYVAWNFFGKCFHVWDTWTGRLRMDTVVDDVTCLMNVETMEGRFRMGDRQFEGEDLERALKTARATWINDSYWLAMPYKLLDPGVRLRGPEEVVLADGRRSLKLRVTFDRVGETPWNAYDVYVSPETHLVQAWGYYRTSGEDRPFFERPWGFERRGRILLPVEHGRGGDWQVEVFDEVPDSVFTEWTPRMNMETLLSIAKPIPRQEPEY